MKPTILITDSLFIFKEHEDALRAAGYEIERLDKPHATEDELVKAVKGKVGYVLGGIEHITPRVIEAADTLKAIVFTGSDWKQFIPGHEEATKKGIAIANTPGANRYAVAEYAITLMLAMTRNIFELGRTGTATFQTRPSMKELTVGIVGMGAIGGQVARMLHGLGVKEIVYQSRQRKADVEKETGARYVDLDTLLQTSDIVTLHFPKEAGRLIDAAKLSLMKPGALLVNCAFSDAVDELALLPLLKSGKLRATFDDPAASGYSDLSLGVWYNSNSHIAYNTHEACKTSSDMAVKSLLNMLKNGKDEFRVN